MLRILLACLVLGCVGFSPILAKDHEVVAQSGGAAGHRWEFDGKSSEKAAVGMPDNCLEIKVGKGDVVRFVVKGGTDGVLFEKATAEQSGKVWEVVKGTGELKHLPSTSGFDRFDRKDARATVAKGVGSTLIEIKIGDLQAGADKAILFACNPHSAMGDAASTTMLGVIVLDQSK